MRYLSKQSESNAPSIYAISRPGGIGRYTIPCEVPDATSCRVATPSTTPSIHPKSRRAQKTVKNEAKADEGEMGSNRMAGSLHEQWWLGAGQFFPRRCRAEFPRARPERGLASERSAILNSISVDHCATKHLTYCGRTSLGVWVSWARGGR